jgi:hypothetical protein
VSGKADYDAGRARVAVGTPVLGTVTPQKKTLQGLEAERETAPSFIF